MEFYTNHMKRRQQNQKFPSFQIFRLAAQGCRGAANKNDRKFLVFAPRELVARGRGAVRRFVQNARKSNSGGSFWTRTRDLSLIRTAL